LIAFSGVVGTAHILLSAANEGVSSVLVPAGSANNVLVIVDDFQVDLISRIARLSLDPK
jgi:hypothetical protein